MNKTKRKLKLLNFFNNKNKKKRVGKKRRIFAFVILVGNILIEGLFGNLLINNSKTQKYSNSTSLAQERIISDQEINSLDDSHISGHTVRIGSGTILEFQQEISNANSVKILSEIDGNELDDTILVKGDGVLPGAEALSTPLLPHQKQTRGRIATGMSGETPGGGGPGGGDGSSPGSKNGSGHCPVNSTPRFAHQPFSKNQNKNKKKKNEVEVRKINNQRVLRVSRNGMPFFVDEMTLRKKIYHATDFGVTLPDNLDLEYVKSLAPKERLKYLSDPKILPQKYVNEYMMKISKHLLDPETEIILGTFGKNGKSRGWKADIITGTHTFNPVTGNDAFFNGSEFHVGMSLNRGQKADLEHNNNTF